MSDSEIVTRVYYQDTDAAGVVFHGSYLNFFERGRTEWLRSCNWSVQKLTDTFNVIFVVRKLDVKFRFPAYLDDVLRIKTRLGKSGRAQITLNQEVYREKVLLVKGSVNLGCVTKKFLRPCSLPLAMKTNLDKLTD